MALKNKKEVFCRFNKFIAGGVLTIIIKIGLVLILTDLLNVWYFFSYLITLAVLISFAFFYNAYITFRVSKIKKQQLILFCIVLLFFYALDAVTVKLFTERLHLHYTMSIMAITAVIFVLKYMAYDNVVFAERKHRAGNYYNKYKSKNFIVKFLMKKFYKNLFRLVGRVNPKKVLEVGCGEGYIASGMKRALKIDIEGSDVDKNVIKFANKKFKGIPFSVETVYNLKRKDKSFDLVIACEVLEHLKCPDKAIEEIKRVSKKYCIFSVPYEPFWRMANIARLAYLSELGNTPGHIQHWTMGSFEKMLKRHFRMVKIKNSILWNIALCSE